VFVLLMYVRTFSSHHRIRLILHQHLILIFSFPPKQNMFNMLVVHMFVVVYGHWRDHC
jgi:hypothetical protein